MRFGVCWFRGVSRHGNVRTDQQRCAIPNRTPIRRVRVRHHRAVGRTRRSPAADPPQGRHPRTRERSSHQRHDRRDRTRHRAPVRTCDHRCGRRRQHLRGSDPIRRRTDRHHSAPQHQRSRRSGTRPDETVGGSRRGRHGCAARRCDQSSRSRRGLPRRTRGTDQGRPVRPGPRTRHPRTQHHGQARTHRRDSRLATRPSDGPTPSATSVPVPSEGR